MNLQVRAIPALLIYIMLQGIFLPGALYLNDLREAGQMREFWLIFALLEFVYLLDQTLYWLIFFFNKEKK